MKQQVQVPLLVAVAVGVVALFVFFGMKAMSAGDLDQGQVKYTPGKPPWAETDPSKKGPGDRPPQAAPPGNAPPGVGAPALGNGK
jgi:hypothetical protein